MIGDRGTLQSQASITIPPKSEPEPDFAIIDLSLDLSKVFTPH